MNGGDVGTITARIACKFSDSLIGRIPATERQIYLTVDDGPSDMSEDLADVLQTHNVCATWFLVGKAAESQRKAVQHIAETGHLFGNHSYRHLDSWKAPWSVAELDLDEGLRAVEHVTGARCVWTRPPFGRVRPATLRWCREHKQGAMLWDVLAYDFGALPSPARVASQVRSKVRSGSIIVMHDRAQDQNLETVEQTIAGLVSDGWTFSRLPAPART